MEDGQHRLERLIGGIQDGGQVAGQLHAVLRGVNPGHLGSPIRWFHGEYRGAARLFRRRGADLWISRRAWIRDVAFG
jgi:hypothetical protein